MDGAVGERAVDLEPSAHEHVEHPPIVGKGRRDEAGDAVRARRRRQVLEQDRAESAPLLIVLDRERDLRLRRSRGAVVARDRHEIVAELGHDREPAVSVDHGEVLELGGGRSRDGREEPEVQRLAREPLVEPEELIVVVGTDPTQVHRPTVGEDDVEFPVVRLRGHGARQ